MGLPFITNRLPTPLTRLASFDGRKIVEQHPSLPKKNERNCGNTQSDNISQDKISPVLDCRLPIASGFTFTCSLSSHPSVQSDLQHFLAHNLGAGIPLMDPKHVPATTTISSVLAEMLHHRLPCEVSRLLKACEALPALHLHVSSTGRVAPALHASVRQHQNLSTDNRQYLRSTQLLASVSNRLGAARHGQWESVGAQGFDCRIARLCKH